MRSTKPLKVLLVEDNAGDILMIKRTLAAEPFPVSVRVAVNGKQAIDVLASHQFDPDLVILDLNVPAQSGLTVLERSRPAAPVVVFSSTTSDAEIQRSFELGVKDVIPKPTDIDDYVQVVSYMVHKWGAGDVGKGDCPPQPGVAI